MLFNGTNVSAPQQFEPMPPGKYDVSVIGAKVEKTLKGHDKLSVTFKVLEGDQLGRQVFENFLLTHDNPKAVEIAAQKLKQLINAAGIGDNLETVDQLLGKKVLVTTKNEQQDEKTYTRASKYETSTFIETEALFG